MSTDNGNENGNKWQMAETESLPELFIMFKRHAYICISTDMSVTIETDKAEDVGKAAKGAQVEQGQGAQGKAQEINIHAAMADNMCYAHNFNTNTKTSQASHSF